MNKLSTNSAYSKAVEDFGFSTKWYSYPLNWLQGKWETGISKLEWVGVLGTATTPWWALQPVASNPIFAAHNLQALNDPIYQKVQDGQVISAEDVLAQETQLNTFITDNQTKIDNKHKELNQYA